MIQDFPLTGVGLNTFPVVVEALYPLVLASADPRPPPHAHNFLLQVGVDFGVPGIMAVLWLLAVVFRLLWKTWPIEARRGQWLATGIAGGLTGHLVFGLTDAVALGAKPGFLLWWAIGLAEIAWRAAHTWTRDECDSQGREPPTPGLQ